MKQTQLPIAAFFYEILLQVYPKDYRKAYGQEMRLLFTDLYQEELAKHKEIGIGFWFRIIGDVIKSTFEQHVTLVSKIGFKKYINNLFVLNRYTSIAFLLLIPFLLLFVIDQSIVLLTGSRELLQGFFHNPFLPIPVGVIILMIFPAIAVLLSTISLVATFKKEEHSVVTFSFLARNLPAIIIFFIGLSAFILLFGHDVIPCIVNQTMKKGLLHLLPTLQYCKNA